MSNKPKLKLKEGFYTGPTGQIIVIQWDDGPGFNTGCMMWSLDGQLWQELTPEIECLLEGWKLLKE
jgi:hypothetical protein